MSGVWGVRACVTLGVILLSMCSAGWALQCFNCDGSINRTCTETITCEASQDACILLKMDVRKIQRCIAFSKCNREDVIKDFSLSGGFKLNCCQKNLCNSSVRSLPSAVMLLGLLTSLLMFFY